MSLPDVPEMRMAGEDLHHLALMSLDACELPRTTLHHLKNV
jgi:hypothetical protein